SIDLNPADSITVDTATTGMVSINWNGRLETYLPGTLKALTLTTSFGRDGPGASVNILATPAGMTTDVETHGPDAVTLGNKGSVLRLNGSILVNSGTVTANVVLDDSGDKS